MLDVQYIYSSFLQNLIAAFLAQPMGKLCIRMLFYIFFNLLPIAVVIPNLFTPCTYREPILFLGWDTGH